MSCVDGISHVLRGVGVGRVCCHSSLSEVWLEAAWRQGVMCVLSGSMFYHISPITTCDPDDGSSLGWHSVPIVTSRACELCYVLQWVYPALLMFRGS